MMEGYLLALAFAGMPMLGNILGGLLAEMMPISERTLRLALHGAVGVVLAVVGVELMPTALTSPIPWLVILGFVAGGVFFLTMDRAIGLVSGLFGAKQGERGPWVIYFGVAMDLFSDGVMIGTASTISLGLGLLLALGQVPADVPEGFATIANFRRKGVPRGQRILLSLGFALPILLGTTVGYWAVRDLPDWVKLTLLAFTAGILTTLAVEEIVPAAHSDGEERLAALLMILGFALFTALSVYLG